MSLGEDFGSAPCASKSRNRLDIAASRRRHKSRIAVHCCSVHGRAMIEQEANLCRVSRGPHERGRTAVRREVGVGAGVQQFTNAGGRGKRRGADQRSRTDVIAIVRRAGGANASRSQCAGEDSQSDDRSWFRHR
jgi:hypothetical protein